MKHISQPPDSNLCGQACVAMLAGITLEESIDVFGKRGATGARYRLQRLESVAMPNILGNCSFPVHTHRWRDIAVSDDKAALLGIMPQSDGYRIEDTRPQEAGEGEKG